MRPCLAALLLLCAWPTPAATRRLAQDGFEAPCDSDSDADRLVNCVEAALLTDRLDPDTDGDGLGDGDEALGTPFGLDLPTLGVSPRHRDLLLEVDWVDDNTGCQLHTHRPTPQTFAEVQAIFAAIPLANPDGTNGINLIVDYGQSSLFSGGNAISAKDGTVTLTMLQVAIQPVHFAANRRGYFRYSIHAHDLGESDDYSGVAAGDANLVTLGCSIKEAGYARNVTAHELGHNLGLQHGGNSPCNRKPNYNSLMNYSYLFHGLDIDCDRFADGIDHVGFSNGTRRTLVKAALVESDGVCAAGDPQAKPIDWNFNGVIDLQPVAVDLACPGTPVVEDWDDIGHLQLAPRTAPNAAEPAPPLPGDLCPVPPQPGEPP